MSDVPVELVVAAFQDEKAAVGLIAGPALIVPAAVGALVGGLAAKARDTGFSDERLKKVGEGLTPGSSAIIAVVDHTWVETLEKEMAEAGADLMTEQLGADIATQLEAGHDVAYTALASQEGYATTRVAAGDDEAEGSEMVVTDEGVYASQFVATKEGFAVRSLTATDEGVLAEEAVVTDEAAAYGAAMATDEGVVAAAITAEAAEEEETSDDDEQES